ncbi:ScbA/BarX family gamma-butyrolactone biosynthesis protein [Streptomyces sp. NBC_01310]|uniref:ScbA/BarX family gamma-butyrolactone biosynthesis protein n=1 Tax=Streptomyces sp. NBC_01310 TaxID=2903820 RepID=UPI0035B617BE
MALHTFEDRVRHKKAPGILVPQPRAEARRVPERLVHRTSATDVLPVTWERTGETRFLATVRWPHDHPSFGPVAGRYSPLVISETLRQTAMLLAHAEFGVPMDHHFVMWDISHTARPEHLRVGPTPAEVTVEVDCSDVRNRGGRLAGMHCHMTIRIGAETVAAGGGDLTITSPAAYRRIRARRLGERLPATPPPPAPEIAAALDAREVMLAPAAGPGRWQLRTDHRHPSVSGRSNDHYPGMVLVAAALQAARAVTPGTFYPASSSIRFSRYAEFSSPCWIEARGVGGSGGSGPSVRVTGHQDGQPVFVAMLAGGPSDSPHQPA